MNERVRWGATYVGAWTALALVTGSQTLLTYQATGGLSPGAVRVVAILTFAYWYSWAAVGIAAVWAARRLSAVRDGWLSSLAAHVPLSFALAGVVLLLFRAIRAWAGYPSSQTFGQDYLFRGGTGLLTYAAIVATVWFVESRKLARRSERRAAELSADLSRARLGALRARLHPHFLFNSLHGIQSLVASDPETAEEMLGELGGLLRAAVDGPEVSDVTLERELGLVEGYLRIQAMRLEDRLRVSTDVEEGLADVEVPPLILQPLVENAVEHAVASRREGGRIEIEARRRGGHLVLRVSDDGPGLGRRADRWGSAGGVGLSATSERLSTRYGDRGTLTVEEREGGGLRVTVRIPFRQAGPEEAVG